MCMPKRIVVPFFLVVLFLLSPLCLASAEVGVTDSEIVIGTSQPMTGGMAFIGNQNISGMTVMIDDINKKGGIFGRKINHVVMDDGYRSDRHIANVRRMIEVNKVFCFVMNLGTPTVAASLPLLNQYKIPLYAPATESRIFDKEPYILAIFASYRQMLIQGLNYMMQQRGKKKIALFYWDNAFGLEHLEAAKEFLTAKGTDLVAEENYKEEDFDMSAQAMKLKKSNADCVALGASLTGCIKIINAMHNIGYYPEILGPLMLVSPGFVKVAGEHSEGVFVTLPFISPADQAVAPYKEMAKKYYPDKPWDDNIMSGMGNIYSLAEACKRVGKDLTREKFIKAVESMSDQNFDNPFLRGAKFRFGPGHHRACSSIMIGQIKAGQLERVTGWLHWKDMPVPEIK